MANQPVYWKMRDGKLISIDDMDINHLRNVLKMIIRNGQKAKALKSETLFKLNGDMTNEFHKSHMSNEDDDRFDHPGLFDEACEVDLY
jgi:hypothetical protein